MNKAYDFLGVRVDVVRMSDVVERVAESITNKQPLNIATVNPELVMIAQKNAEFASVLAAADVVTPDGVGLLMVGAVSGRKLPERVTGADLCQELASQAAQQNWNIYLLGAKPGVAQKAADKLAAKYPGLKITADSSDPENADVSKIAGSGANILLVAYGSPKQELWISQHRQQLGTMVTIGVGGSFDFIAGNIQRAPKFIQKIGLEWLWRTILQPWRLKRILVLPKFAILALTK